MDAAFCLLDHFPNINILQRNYTAILRTKNTKMMEYVLLLYYYIYLMKYLTSDICLRIPMLISITSFFGIKEDLLEKHKYVI